MPKAICLLLLLLVPLSVQAVDLHSDWDQLLKKHVHQGEVNYTALKEDEKKLDVYLSRLDATNPGVLSRNDQLAYYINAYNAYTVKLILRNFISGRPVESIKDIGGLFSSPWSISFVHIGGLKMSLDDVEHEILRPRFNEPRIHFAINCAAKSCPPLISEAYTGAEVEKQLQRNTVSFLNDPKANYVAGNTLYVSKIFKWFGVDFGNDIGGFVKKYAAPEMLGAINGAGSDLQVRFLKYDWSLNGF
ncbi:DUF547 domain-containing protein [Desulfosediminicola sp.]|uniref:DUF547 domain-containing protein n=1 Tax=Desulfosediminicola sp. TaxID=2886825 RepID=UPI003AF2324E